jgi:hypothetical protein
VSDIGDVSYVANLEAEKSQVAGNDVKSEERPDVTQMHIIIDRRAANVHSHETGIYRLECFFFAGKGVCKMQGEGLIKW